MFWLDKPETHDQGISSTVMIISIACSHPPPITAMNHRLFSTLSGVLWLLMLAITAPAQSTYEPYYFGTFAGLAPGSADGTGSNARFYNPAAVAVDSNRNVYVADQYNHTIRKITPAGVVSTLAGLAGSSGSDDGTGSAARFFQPDGEATDLSGRVYVA